MKLKLIALLFACSMAFGDTPPPDNTDQLPEGSTNLYSTSARIDARITAQKGVANGLATLDGSGKVPSAQLPSSGGTWGSITGTLSDQTDLQSALNAKEPSISAGTSLQYWRGDKTFQTLNTLAVPELTNLYYTQARFDSAFSGKSTTNLSEGSNLYWTQGRFDTAFGLKSTTNLTEGSNLYYTQGRFDTAFSGKSTSNLSEGSNLYYTNARVDSEFDTRLATKTTTNLAEGSNLYFTNARAQGAVSATAPLVDTAGVFSIPVATSSVNGYLSSTDWSTFNGKQAALSFGNLTDAGTDGLTVTGGTGAVIGSGTSLAQHVADLSHNGYLSQSDWNTFNNKLDKSSGNYITNPDFELNTTGWNLYNDSGNPIPASVIIQDITYTSALSGSGGNGATISYTLCGSSYVGPIVTCPTSTSVQVCWYNGPTLAQNPTATVLKAAYDAQSCATAIATSAITGTASNLQYETGTSTLGGGGDTSPVDGTGGVTSGVTFTRNTSTPLIGTASGDLGKNASSEQGQGVSTDFVINSVDKDTTLQISFVYSGSAAMVLGASSDVQVFVYDIGNAVLIPVKPKQTIAGPVSTAKTFVGTFLSSSSSNYRLILHIATTNASAWDLLLDSVTINDQVTPGTTVQVPSVVLKTQPISGTVTDHMVVMWTDGATQWVPATIAGAALPVFGDDKTQLGFATNIVGSVADIYVHGSMSGFSFGPFLGFEQYIDTTAGGISPLPSPFNDMYVMVGMAVASDTLNIQFDTHVDQISNGSGVPVKGGLLTATAANDGTGDVVVPAGTTGQFPMYNTANVNGIVATTPVATSPITYTASTHTWALSTVPVASGGTGLTSTSQNFVFSGPTSGSGAPTWRLLVAGDVPTLNQNTTGSAAKWTTARNLAGNSVDGSANVAFSNKFVVQGTADAGLSAAQFLGALGTGIVKNTTTTGVLSIAVAGDFPTLNQNTSGSAASFTGSLSGDVTGTQSATAISAATVTGKALTGFVSGAGTITATDTILTGFNKINGNDLLKAPLASPTFTGTVTLPPSNLANGASAATNGVLVVKDGHIKSTLTTVPTATVNANAGTGATCTLAHAVDEAGIITLVSGTVGTPATGTQCTINFNKAFATIPVCWLSAASAAAATNLVQVMVGTTTTSAFPFTFNVAAATSATYTYTFGCKETQ